MLLRLAGHDWFRQTGTAYLKLHPSRSGNLHHVGERFASFLEATLGDGAYAYFVDVARLDGRTRRYSSPEWLCTRPRRAGGGARRAPRRPGV